MDMNMIKAGVVGATGYAGEEVIKILIRHKDVKITELSAIIDKEEPISSLLPHKVSMEIAPAFLKAGKLVVDLSADYRLDPKVYEKWYGIAHKDTANLAQAVYGLPELYSDLIKKAKLLANPGCYPTSVILGVAPALAGRAVDRSYMIADSKSGATGAGRKADIGLIFCEVNENLKAYKVNDHQHKPEINRILSRVAGEEIDIVFTPHLIPMNRGILSTIYMKLAKPLDTEAAVGIYKAFYKGKPFVRVYDAGKLPQTKDVVGTNFCDIGVKASGSTLIVVSCIDNLVKGAAGQAVQNMNLMCGFSETEGLL
jgi:N-acetyl-gamma-glutamyl-phosphate reductase